MIRDFSAQKTNNATLDRSSVVLRVPRARVSSLVGNLRVIGPGMIWAVAAIGSGELIISARAGAEYGTIFLWALWIGVWAKYWIHRAVFDLTVSTGRPVTELWSESRFGRVISSYWVVFFLISSVGLAGLIGLSASILFMVFPQVGVTGWAMVVAVALVALSYLEDYGKFEKTMLGFGFLIAVGVLTTVVLSRPEPRDLIAWEFPRTFSGSLIFLSIFGWGAGSGPDLILPYSWWVLEKESKGHSSPDAKQAQRTTDRDKTTRLRSLIGNYGLIGGYLCTGVVASAFMIVGARILKPRGAIVDGVDVLGRISMIFTDTYGGRASLVFLIGAFAALFSTAFGVLDGGRVVLTQTARSLIHRPLIPVTMIRTNRVSRMTLVLFASIALLIFAFGKRPVALVMCASIVSAISMPVVGLLTLWGLFKHLPKESRPSWFSIANLLVSVLIFLVLMIKAIWFREIL